MPQIFLLRKIGIGREPPPFWEAVENYSVIADGDLVFPKFLAKGPFCPFYGSYGVQSQSKIINLAATRKLLLKMGPTQIKLSKCHVRQEKGPTVAPETSRLLVRSPCPRGPNFFDQKLTWLLHLLI